MTTGSVEQQIVRLRPAAGFAAHRLDYSILDRHFRVLKHPDATTTGVISVFDRHRRVLVYVGSHFAMMFDWDMTKGADGGAGTATPASIPTNSCS